MWRSTVKVHTVRATRAARVAGRLQPTRILTQHVYKLSTAAKNSSHFPSKYSKQAKLLASKEVKRDVQALMEEAATEVARRSSKRDGAASLADYVGDAVRVKAEDHKDLPAELFSTHDFGDSAGESTMAASVDNLRVRGEFVDDPDWYIAEPPGFTGTFNESEAYVSALSRDLSLVKKYNIDLNSEILDPQFFYSAQNAADVDLARYNRGAPVPAAVENPVETAKNAAALKMPWDHRAWWDSTVRDALNLTLKRNQSNNNVTSVEELTQMSFDELWNDTDSTELNVSNTQGEIPTVPLAGVAAQELTPNQHDHEASRKASQLIAELFDENDPDAMETHEWNSRIMTQIARMAAVPDAQAAEAEPQLHKDESWKVPSRNLLFNPLRNDEQLGVRTLKDALEVWSTKSVFDTNQQTSSPSTSSKANSTDDSDTPASNDTQIDLFAGLRDDITSTSTPSSDRHAGSSSVDPVQQKLDIARETSAKASIDMATKGERRGSLSRSDERTTATQTKDSGSEIRSYETDSGSEGLFDMYTPRDPNFSKPITDPADSDYMSATDDQEDYWYLFRRHKQGPEAAAEVEGLPEEKDQRQDDDDNDDGDDDDLENAAEARLGENGRLISQEEWGWDDMQPGAAMYTRMLHGASPDAKILQHSRAYTPYHRRLLQCMQRRDLQSMFVLWNFERTRKLATADKSKPDYIAYHIMLDACARARAFDLMGVVFDDMTRRCADTTPEVHKLMIKAAALAEDIDSAVGAFNRMVHTANIKPDVHCYAPIISTAARKHKFELAMDWFNRMRRGGVYPTESIFRSLLQPIVDTSSHVDLHFVWRAMRNHTSIPLHESTWDLLLRGFIQAQNAEDVWDVYSDMRSKSRFGKSILPDAQQACDIFNCLASQGRFREARQLRRHMDEYGMFTSGVVSVSDIDTIMARFPPEDQELSSELRTVEGPYGNPYFTDDVDETRLKANAVLHHNQKIGSLHETIPSE